MEYKILYRSVYTTTQWSKYLLRRMTLKRAKLLKQTNIFTAVESRRRGSPRENLNSKSYFVISLLLYKENDSIIVALVHIFGACLIETLIFLFKKFIVILN